MVSLWQFAIAGDLDGHCENWSKDPKCWDKSYPDYEHETCPEEYVDLVILTKIRETAAGIYGTFYTLEEHEMMQDDPTLHVWAMDYDLGDLNLSVGDIVEGTIAYTQMFMRTGDIYCSRYLKELH